MLVWFTHFTPAALLRPAVGWCGPPLVGELAAGPHSILFSCLWQRGSLGRAAALSMAQRDKTKFSSGAAQLQKSGFVSLGAPKVDNLMFGPARRANVLAKRCGCA